jgi:hypothetical protein
MQFAIKSVPKFFFLFVGLFIVFLSFMSANTIFSQGESLHLAEKKMYLKKEVLPDHLFYPLFMAFDRARLSLAKEDQKSELNISYGWQRLDATKELLEKGYQSLSFSTLTKACKYQNLGLLAAKDLSQPEKEKAFFQAEQFREQVNFLKDSFNDVQQGELNTLLQEQELFAQNLLD